VAALVHGEAEQLVVAQPQALEHGLAQVGVAMVQWEFKFGNYQHVCSSRQGNARFVQPSILPRLPGSAGKPAVLSGTAPAQHESSRRRRARRYHADAKTCVFFHARGVILLLMLFICTSSARKIDSGCSYMYLYIYANNV
jgi:hypothetical protein